jgi:hypothetical protein
MPMPQPRNPFRDSTTVNLDSKTYDRFVRAYGTRPAKASFRRLVEWFNSLPPDAQEVIMGRLSKGAQVRVLQAVIRQLQKP